MRALELKIPPPVVALVVSVAMWGISLVTSRFEISAAFRYAAVTLIAIARVRVCHLWRPRNPPCTHDN